MNRRGKSQGKKGIACKAIISISRTHDTAEALEHERSSFLRGLHSKRFCWGFICFSLFDHADIGTRAKETAIPRVQTAKNAQFPTKNASYVGYFLPEAFVRIFSAVSLRKRLQGRLNGWKGLRHTTTQERYS